jgi:ketosteroid isomerase-like protein
MSMVRANSAVKIAGPRHGTTSIVRFGASRVIFSISGGTTFADSLAEDACWTVTGENSWSQQFKGRDAIMNGLMGYFRSFFAERPRTVAFNFIADGGYVAVEARGDNVTKTGQRYDNHYCLVFRVVDGKIAEIKEYLDSALVERVLGPFPEERKRSAG